MQKSFVRKGLAVGIIVLFVGASVVPSIGGDLFSKNVEDVNNVSEKSSETKDSGMDVGSLLNGNLISHWKFDEGSGSTVYDSEGDNDGTIYGATWTTNTPSGEGYALSFDGVDDHVDITDVSDFYFADQSLTYSAWVQIRDNANVYRSFICLEDYIDAYPHIRLCKWRSDLLDGRIYFAVRDASQQGVHCCSIDDGDALPKDQWIHVAGVVDYASGLVTLYLNGIAQESKPATSFDMSEAEDLRLVLGSFACPYQVHQGPHYGLIDEVRIYNRALSQGEIEYLYNNLGSGNQPPTQGFVGHWNFIEGSGNIAYDRSGNDNDGAIYGASWTTGISGMALDFDGIDDWVEAGPVLLQKHTINLWVKVDNAVGGGDVLIENPRGVGQRTDYGLYIGYSNSNLYPVYLLRRSSDDTAEIISGAGNCDMSFDDWYMITASYDGSSAKIYLNGNLIVQEDVVITLQQLGVYFAIGDDGPGDNYPFNGIIDEVRIYNRALSQGEIEYLHNNPGSEYQRSEKPRKPVGPKVSNEGESKQYCSYWVDSEGDNFYYKFDWGDGTDTGWLESIDIGEFCAQHTWNIRQKNANYENFEIKAKIKDINGMESRWSDSLTIAILNENNPPLKPDIYGFQDEVEIMEKFRIRAYAYDYNCDDLAYQVDWDISDNDYGEWSDFVPGFPNYGWFEIEHCYHTKGIKEIKVRAKDERGYIGPWSDPVTVEVVYNGLKPGYIETSSCWLEVHTIFGDYVPRVESLGVEYTGVDPQSDGTYIYNFQVACALTANKEQDLYICSSDDIFVYVDSDQDWLPTWGRIGGNNVTDKVPDPDPSPYTEFAISLCAATIDTLLALATGGMSLPFASFITSGYFLAEKLDDAEKRDPDVTWEVTKSCRDAAGFFKVKIPVDPEFNDPDGKWEATFNSGAYRELAMGGEEIRLDLNKKDWFTYDTVGNGVIKMGGPIPPSNNRDNMLELDEIFIYVLCPVNVTVYTANGLYISNLGTDMENATYDEIDLDGDGDLDKQIYIPRGWYGNYSIYIHPYDNASQNDTFSIIVNDGGQNTTLVDNETISNVNESIPYNYIKTEPNWGPTITGPTSGSTHTMYNFTVNSTTLYNITVYEYLVDWGNNSVERYNITTGTFNLNENVSCGHIWQKPGTYNIRVKTKDSLGQVSNWSTCHTIQLTGPPYAEFGYSPSYPDTNETITLNDISVDDNTIVNWTWDFDDGNISYNQNPTYQYTNPGNYTVVLNVTSDDTLFDTYSALIEVMQDANPVAYFMFNPLYPEPGQNISFMDFSYDLDDTIVNWSWDFDDGNVSNIINPIHNYSDYGSYNVTLTVTDEDGSNDSIIREINISDVPPLADFYYSPLYPKTDDWVYFIDNSYESYGELINWTWDFGDGAVRYEQYPIHKYTSVGNHTINLTVTDDDGENDSISKNITVLDGTPPEISNVIDFPDPQVNVDYVNISCNVSDNAWVSNVNVNISYPTSGFVNFSIIQNKTGNTYYCTKRFSEVGNYSYYIWANDTSNNGNTSDIYTFSIVQDSTPPTINDNTASTAYTEDQFIFNTTVTDNFQVSTTWVEYWYGTGSHTNVSMTNVACDYWEYTITIDDLLDILHYIISANDTSNNWNNTGIKDVSIYDNDNPEITDIQATPPVQVIGGYVNISAMVVDNMEVDEVYLYMECPDSSVENFSITQNKTGDAYYCNRTYHQIGMYTYHIWANDTSGNEDISEAYTFEIILNNPPVFGSPAPINGSTGNPLSFTWQIPINDPEGDSFDWNIDCSNGQSNGTIGDTNGTKTLALTDLSYSTTYTVWVNATDPGGSGLYNREWYTFTTKVNTPPSLGTPNPANGSTGQPLAFTWSIEIIEPDDLVDWSIECSNGYSNGSTNDNPGTKSLTLFGLSYSTSYTIWVNVTDGYAWVREWFTFTTIDNNPPNPPSDPDPFDNETDVDINANLSWSCSDPEGHNLRYDIYFGESSSPPLVEEDWADTTFDPGTLDYETIYYWQIIAEDEFGAVTDGPIWSFTTEDEPPKIPDLDCSGTLSWTGVTPGDTVSGSFTVENVGEPESLLDWEIDEYPTWGDWTFTPSSGDDLIPNNPVTVEVTVIAPDEPETEFTGEVKIVNSEDPDDTCVIDVSLATPVNQFQSTQQIPRFMQIIIERFPVLRQVLGL